MWRVYAAILQKVGKRSRFCYPLRTCIFKSEQIYQVLHNCRPSRSWIVQNVRLTAHLAGKQQQNIYFKRCLDNRVWRHHLKGKGGRLSQPGRHGRTCRSADRRGANKTRRNKSQKTRRNPMYVPFRSLTFRRTSYQCTRVSACPPPTTCHLPSATCCKTVL